MGTETRQAKLTESVRVQARNEMTWADDDRRAAAVIAAVQNAISSRIELRKVVWPGREETIRMTTVVFFFAVAMGPGIVGTTRSDTFDTLFEVFSCVNEQPARLIWYTATVAGLAKTRPS